LAERSGTDRPICITTTRAVQSIDSRKIALFRRLFRGRTDVHPVHWESATTDKSGYAPACANEWRPGICEKPRIKCADCGNRSLIPVSDAVIYNHLAGEKTIGVYPLLPDDTCYFLAVDFDKAEWPEDAKAFVQSCCELDVPVALEISRSGNGAHAWGLASGVGPMQPLEFPRIPATIERKSALRSPFSWMETLL
jgi:hypothetical protein